VRQVGYLQEMNRDAWSTKHKIMLRRKSPRWDNINWRHVYKRKPVSRFNGCLETDYVSVCLLVNPEVTKNINCYRLRQYRPPHLAGAQLQRPCWVPVTTTGRVLRVPTQEKASKYSQSHSILQVLFCQSVLVSNLSWGSLPDFALSNEWYWQEGL
jgi:hypothetical protein